MEAEFLVVLSPFQFLNQGNKKKQVLSNLSKQNGAVPHAVEFKTLSTAESRLF